MGFLKKYVTVNRADCYVCHHFLARDLSLSLYIVHLSVDWILSIYLSHIVIYLLQTVYTYLSIYLSQMVHIYLYLSQSLSVYLIVVVMKGQKWITQTDVSLQQYIFMKIQTVMVTGNWLDLLASVAIYSVGKGPCSDVMGYINITLMQTVYIYLSIYLSQFRSVSLSITNDSYPCNIEYSLFMNISTKLYIYICVCVCSWLVGFYGI